MKAKPAKKPAKTTKSSASEKSAKKAKKGGAAKSKKPKVFLPGPKMNPVAKRALAKRGLLEKKAKKAGAKAPPSSRSGQRKSRLPQMPPPRLVMPAKPAPKSAPAAASKSKGVESRPAKGSRESAPPPNKPSSIPPRPAKPLTKPAASKPALTKGSPNKSDGARLAQRPPPPSVGPRSTGPLKNAGKSLVLAPARSSAGTDRAGAKGAPGRGVTLVRRTSDRPTGNTAPLLPTPLRTPTIRVTLEDRAASIEKRLENESDEFRQRFYDQFDMSWIYHDSALEGVVYTMEELRAGLSKTDPTAVVVDSGLQPAADEIRRHKEAIEFVRDYATKKRLPPTIDTVKKIYLILHPSEGDLKTVKYRRDIPQHRLYFHEYAQPDQIAYKVRKIVDWVNDPEVRKSRGALRIAARAHYDMLRVFPFQSDSGKVARLFMNLLLMRVGLPPSIIHLTERQRYYDALKGSANIVLTMVQESVENAVASVEKLLDEHGSKKRPSSP
ncbi:MAG: Fic family protein [Polyangiaceae bacterium]